MISCDICTRAVEHPLHVLLNTCCTAPDCTNFMQVRSWECCGSPFDVKETSHRSPKEMGCKPSKHVSYLQPEEDELYEQILSQMLPELEKQPKEAGKPVLNSNGITNGSKHDCSGKVSVHALRERVSSLTSKDISPSDDSKSSDTRSSLTMPPIIEFTKLEAIKLEKKKLEVEILEAKKAASFDTIRINSISNHTEAKEVQTQSLETLPHSQKKTVRISPPQKKKAKNNYDKSESEHSKVSNTTFIIRHKDKEPGGGSKTCNLM